MLINNHHRDLYYAMAGMAIRCWGWSFWLYLVQGISSEIGILHGQTLSRTTAQDYGGYRIEEYEAGMDCEAMAVEQGIPL